mmetsp:Transcript_11746/g.37637  ORF Transcript_11746/g.37637 Transcript_11746/m.37637 type:complete len:236 (-) Transcript_11746:14-721(-)
MLCEGRRGPGGPIEEGGAADEAHHGVQEVSGGDISWESPIASSQACAQPNHGEVPQRVEGDNGRLLCHSRPLVGKGPVSHGLDKTSNATERGKPHASAQHRVVVPTCGNQSKRTQDVHHCKVDAPDQEQEARDVAQTECGCELLPGPVVVDQVPLGDRQPGGVGQGDGRNHQRHHRCRHDASRSSRRCPSASVPAPSGQYRTTCSRGSNKCTWAPAPRVDRRTWTAARNPEAWCS